jgi:Virulence-associated protein E
MIANFLSRYRPDGPWCLVAIDPEGKADTTARTFDNPAKAAAWAAEQSETRNLYHHANRTAPGLNKKATKAQIVALEVLHVDIDPRAREDFEAERQRIRNLLTSDLPAGIPAPTLIVDSGNGFNAYWRLKEPVPLNGDADKIAEAERFNIELARVFGADACHNVDRLLRLPGTTNRPNKKKRDAGRQARDAEVLGWNREVQAYPLSEFRQAPKHSTGPAGASTGPAKARGPAVGAGLAVAVPAGPVGVDELRAWAATNQKTLTDTILAVIATGDDPLQPGRYADRSRAVFYVACELVRAGLPDELIVGALIGPNAIAAHVLGQPQPSAYAQRQVQRARESEESSWSEVDKDGRPRRSYPNTVTALRRLGMRCSYDVFRCRNIVEGHELQEFVGEFSDQAESLLRLAVREAFGFDPGKENVRDAVAELCVRYRFDSLLDHLNGLPAWDATLRLDTWLVTYCGAVDTPYTREAGATWLTAAVVRAFEPGTKFDHMLVLVGGQGIGKSSALRILAGGDAFFSDANFLGARDTREVLEATSGAWIVECAELAGMRRKETEVLKHEITKQEDKGRPAYARSALSVPRRFVLGGTTNSGRFLQDDTGNRRFWPVEVGAVRLADLSADRSQIVAEAIARYRAGGCRLFLQGEAAEGALAAQKDGRAVEDGFVEQLECLRWSQTYKGKPAVTTEAVYNVLMIPRERRQGQNAINVCRAMQSLGWTKLDHPVRLDNDARQKQRAYVWEGAAPLPPRADASDYADISDDFRPPF